jgi:hypothetical protein
MASGTAASSAEGFARFGFGLGQSWRNGTVAARLLRADFRHEHLEPRITTRLHPTLFGSCHARPLDDAIRCGEGGRKAGCGVAPSLGQALNSRELAERYRRAGLVFAAQYFQKKPPPKGDLP